MRKSGWMLVPLAAAVLLGGCRSTACEDLAEAYAEVARKSQPCVELAPLPAFESGRCEQLKAQVACYQGLATCNPERPKAFFQALTTCDSYALSNTCEAAIF